MKKAGLLLLIVGAVVVLIGLILALACPSKSAPIEKAPVVEKVDVKATEKTEAKADAKTEAKTDTKAEVKAPAVPEKAEVKAAEKVVSKEASKVADKKTSIGSKIALAGLIPLILGLAVSLVARLKKAQPAVAADTAVKVDETKKEETK